MKAGPAFAKKAAA